MVINNPKELVALRFARQGLVEPFSTAAECIRELVGVQAQAQQFAELTIFQRTEPIQDIELSFAEENIVKIWGHRMTVHLHTKEDWALIYHMHSGRNNWLQQFGPDVIEAYKNVLAGFDALPVDRAVSKDEILSIVREHAGHIDHPYRDYGMIKFGTIDGYIYGVPKKPAIKDYCHRRRAGIGDTEYSSWNSPARRNDFLAEALLRYLHTYGPATIADFCHWSGLPLKDITPALESVWDKIQTLSEGKKPLLNVPNRRDDAADGATATILLGKFDPLFVSYSDKSWIADEKARKAIWRSAAHVEAVVLDDCSLLGTWRYQNKGRKLYFTIEQLTRINAAAKKRIGIQAEKICGHLGKELQKIEYV